MNQQSAEPGETEDRGSPAMLLSHLAQEDPVQTLFLRSLKGQSRGVLRKS